jgi:hypothetical protein
MAEYTDRASFIPYRRKDLIELCIQDGKLSSSDAQRFRHFCEILSAYYHFRFHETLESLKNGFAPFDPDADTMSLKPLSAIELEDMENKLVGDFVSVLQSANYEHLSETDLQKAFQEESLIPLNTDVDFSDFENGRVIFYHRGRSQETVQFRKWFFKKVDISFEAFDRVVMLIKFKGKDHFERKKKKFETMNFSPGKMYVYCYKKIPKFDLDILFPNVDVSMNWKDLVKFGVPAIGALVPIILKTLPNILLIIGVILFFSIGPAAAEKWGANEDTVNNFFPILTAILSMGFMLGGYAVKQYMNYKNKRLKFLKNVTDTLFFKNMDCNAGVFHRLIDEAEEEECKEIILVYYFLLTHKNLTKSELDDCIEKWMEEKLGTVIDFDVDKALKNMEMLTAEDHSSLVGIDSTGKYQVLPIDRANQLIDYVWDNFFTYNASSK